MKAVVSFVILFFCLQINLLAQETTSIAWFEQLFQSQKSVSVEKEIQRLNENQKGAHEIHDGPKEARAFIELGILNLTQLNNNEKAMDALIRSLAVEDSLLLTQERIFAFVALARVFEEVGYYNKSREYLKLSLALTEKQQDETLKVYVLLETGRVNAAYGSTDDALDNFKQALSYSQALNQADLQADALFYWGKVLSRKGNYTEALNHHKEALKIRRATKDKVNEAVSLNEIGELYLLMKKNDRALANHLAALDIRKELKDKKGLAETYNNVGKIYLHLKDYKRSIANLNLALEIDREIENKELQKLSYDYLSQSYKAGNDYKYALYYREEFTAMQEFIFHEITERELLEIQSIDSLNQKELKINVLETDRQQREQIIDDQNKQKNFLILIIALGGVILLLILYLYVSNRKTSKKLKELNGTKDKLFSIIGHDLKGPLNSLTSFSSLLINHADKLSKEEIKMLSTDLDKSLKNLMALLENLLEWSRSQTGSIDFKAEPFDIHAVIRENIDLLSGLAELKKINIVYTNTTEVLVNAHRYSINTVVRNLLSNAIKFTPQGGTISILLDQGNILTISVQDTGVGMAAETVQKLFQLGSKVSTLGTAKEKGTGLGLILCKDFVEKNGGTIGVESKEGEGSRFYFTVPAI
jgi:signal transduction histidine kinase